MFVTKPLTDSPTVLRFFLPKLVYWVKTQVCFVPSQQFQNSKAATNTFLHLVLSRVSV